MDMAQKLDCVTPGVCNAYDNFNTLRGGNQVWKKRGGREERWKRG